MASSWATMIMGAINNNFSMFIRFEFAQTALQLLNGYI